MQHQTFSVCASSSAIATAIISLLGCFSAGCSSLRDTVTATPVGARDASDVHWDTAVDSGAPPRGEKPVEKVVFTGGDEDYYYQPVYGGEYGYTGIPQGAGYVSPYGDPGEVPFGFGALGEPNTLVVGPPTRMAMRVEGEPAVALDASRILQRAYLPLRHCYEGLVAREPSAEGSLIVSFVIGKDGKVEKGATTSGTPGDADLAKCMLKTVGELPFAASSTEAKLSATFDMKIPPPPPPNVEPRVTPVIPARPLYRPAE
jgi:hypothetical protein